MADRMTKIGVYYDGNYFLHVSNYYNYDHVRKRRLSVVGLHRFIMQEVARAEDVDPRRCRIVDGHYFRGRLSAQEAFQRGQVIYWDRVFDDILASAGVSTHYSAQKSTTGRREDKGLDISLALEAYDQAIHRKLDVVVLIAGDGDYVPLLRKLNALGTRVMVLHWNFEFTNDNGATMVTRSSQDLLDESSYPVPVHDAIDGKLKRPAGLIDELFVNNTPQQSDRRGHPDFKDGDNAKEPPAPPADIEYEEPMEGEVGELMISSILSLKNGYGFIKYPPNNLFFHYTTVKNIDFNELLIDDQVEFRLAHNSEGQLIATDVSLLEEEEE